MKFNDLAILIPTRNRPEILRRTLRELRLLGQLDRPLFIYDDASTDPTAVQNVIRDEWPSAHLIRSAKRTGQAAGRNALLRCCTCEFALFLDDDSFPEDWNQIENFMQQAASNRQWAVATFQYRSLADGKLSIPPAAAPSETRSFLGGASIHHVPAILSMDGFRDFLVYGNEEPELSLRLRLAGHRIFQDPSVVILHNHFETPEENRDYREYDFLYTRNRLLMYSMNLPLPLGLPFGLAKSARYVLHSSRNLRTKIRGLISGFTNTWVHRKERLPCTWQQGIRVLRGLL